MNNKEQEKRNKTTNDEVEEPIISRFADDSTFAPRVVIKGDGSNPLISDE